TVTHLATALIAPDRESLTKRVERVRTPSMSPEAFSVRVNAGTVEDHIGRFRGLAEAGVQTAIMSLADIDDPAALEAAADVIAAFGG
ncbi:MAG TPA: hypothetical protein VGF22_07085, partial [Acidimicrobiales bacterium]